MTLETNRKWPALLCAVAIGVLAVAHFIFLMHWFAPAITQPDANGYFAQATYIAKSGRTYFELASPLQYINMHWMKTDDGRYYSHYPPGFGVLLSVPYALSGPSAAMITNVAMCSLALVALYLVTSAWVGRGWGLLAAALVAVNPQANQWALGYFAHTVVACFLMWGLWCLVRWEGSARIAACGAAAPGCEEQHGRGRPCHTSILWAVPAGFLLGVLPSLRYPAALYAAAAGVFGVLVIIRHRPAWRSALAGLVAAAVPMLALAAHNHAAFGAFWKTGYSLTNEQTGFSWEWFTQHATDYLTNLGGGGAGVLFGLGLVGIAALSAQRKTWREGALLALMVVPITLLYMSYYWSGGRQASGSMRFLVPTFYLYAIGAASLLSIVAEVRQSAAVTAGAVLLAVTACWGIPTTMQELDRLEPRASALAMVTEKVDQFVPEGSVIVAGNGIQQHLEFVGKWKLADESFLNARGVGAGRMMRRFQGDDTSQPSPMQREKIEDRMTRYTDVPADMRFEMIAGDLRAWAGGEGKVFWLTDEDTLAEMKRDRWLDTFKTVGEVEIPEPPEDTRRRGGMFGGPPGMGPAGAGPGAPGADPARQQTAAARMRRRGGGFGGGMGVLAGGKLLIVQWTIR